MHSFHIKKGDEAVVIAGADKGKRGRVIAVLGKKQRCIIEGARMIKKHMRKSQQYPNGQIVEREGSLHISNVRLNRQLLLSSKSCAKALARQRRSTRNPEVQSVRSITLIGRHGRRLRRFQNQSRCSPSQERTEIPL